MSIMSTMILDLKIVDTEDLKNMSLKKVGHLRIKIQALAKISLRLG